MNSLVMSNVKAASRVTPEVRKVFFGYVWAIVSMLVVFALQLAHKDFAAKITFTMFLPAVIFSSIYGGLGPAVLAILLGDIFGCYILPPYNTIYIHTRPDIYRLLIFISIGSTFAILNEWQRYAIGQAQEFAKQASIRLELLENEIEERKLVQRALTETATQLRSITNSLTAMIACVDMDEKFIFVNKPFADCYGVNDQVLIGMSILELVGPEAYAKSKPQLDSCLAGRKVEYEGALTTRNGENPNAHSSLVPLIGEEGTQKGFVALIREVPRRKV